MSLPTQTDGNNLGRKMDGPGGRVLYPQYEVSIVSGGDDLPRGSSPKFRNWDRSNENQ